MILSLVTLTIKVWGETHTHRNAFDCVSNACKEVGLKLESLRDFKQGKGMEDSVTATVLVSSPHKHPFFIDKGNIQVDSVSF